MAPSVDWLDARQQRFWRALVVGTTLLMARLDEDLQREFDLSLHEYEILVRLSERPDRRMRMSHLADALRHSRSRITHTVSRMEAASLVERHSAPEDRRGVFAQMTDEGMRVLEKAAPLHVAGVREHLVDLVPADDFETMGKVMDAVTDALAPAHPGSDIRTPVDGAPPDAQAG